MIDMLEMQRPNGLLTIARVTGGETRDLIQIEIRDKDTREIVIQCYLYPEDLTFALTGWARRPCIWTWPRREEGRP